MAVLGLVSLTSAGCLFCLPVDFQTGAKIRLVNSASGESIAGATIVLTDGEFTETMSETGVGRYEGGFGLGGPFSLQIEAEGFAARTVEDFESRTDACGLFEFETVELTAG